MISFLDPNTGPVAGGIDVDVHGSHFAAGHTCFFGESAAAVVWRGGSTLKCKLPPGGRPGPVYVTIDRGAATAVEGTANEIRVVFTYQDNESPLQEM